MNTPVFLDTSGLYAVFDGDDSHHPAVAREWAGLIDSGAALHTSNYVLVELIALLQCRLGLPAVDAFTSFVLPWIRVEWVDERTHEQALAGVLSARRRDLSLVDTASFLIMRKLGIKGALTIDKHFAEQGFKMLPLVGTS